MKPSNVLMAFVATILVGLVCAAPARSASIVIVEATYDYYYWPSSLPGTMAGYGTFTVPSNWQIGVDFIPYVEINPHQDTGGWKQIVVYCTLWYPGYYWQASGPIKPVGFLGPYTGSLRASIYVPDGQSGWKPMDPPVTDQELDVTGAGHNPP